MSNFSATRQKTACLLGIDRFRVQSGYRYCLILKKLL